MTIDGSVPPSSSEELRRDRARGRDHLSPAAKFSPGRFEAVLGMSDGGCYSLPHLNLGGSSEGRATGFRGM
jgi:hypothetical protein